MRTAFAGTLRSIVALGLVAAIGSAARAENPVPALGGVWSGSGQVKLAGGQTEAIRCRAYYNPKSGGQALSIAMTCASATAKIDMRANLEFTGSAVHGNWEERSYNQSGSVTGKSDAGHLHLAIESGGVSGSLSVAVNGASQTVSISTNGAGFSGVNIHLSKG
jgi:hypothetical protein